MVNIIKNENIETFRIYSQKMELLVSLANDVAHSFNDILQTIKSNLELAIIDTKEDAKSYAYLSDAYEAIKQGSDLTSRLEILGKKFESVAQIINLKNELTRIKPILRRNLPKRIKLKINIDQNIPPIIIDPFHLEQLFLHLALNAKDAILDTGVFSISINNISNGVKIEVYDNGKGISEEIKHHMFEPFFTTKVVDSTRMGLSTGLGLYIVEKIVKDNNGIIEVESSVGKGTKFIIHLPTKTNNEPKNESIEDKLKAGTETILLIEDNDGVRIICRKALTRFGYNVLTATAGCSGINIFQNNNVDLVLLDLILNNENGSVILEELRTINPHIKCIVMSGYGIPEEAKNRLNASAYLHKPFTIEKLLQVIRKVLD